MTDNVNHPSHYTDGNIEVIDFIEDKKLNYHLGNAVKYISRAGKKDPEKYTEDLQKAVWYLQREIDRKRWPPKLGLAKESYILLNEIKPSNYKVMVEMPSWRNRVSIPFKYSAKGLQELLETGVTPSDGSEFEVELTDGTKIVLQYGTDKKGNKFLVFKDPMWREQMNEDWKKPNYWRDTDLRAKCNGEYYDLLPDWLKPYVAAAMRSGLTAGWPDGDVFGAEEPITGAEAAVMLQNALDLTAKEAASGAESVPAWAADALLTLASHGIELDADEILTRGDAAEVIYQVAQLKFTAPGLLALRAAQ